VASAFLAGAADDRGARHLDPRKHEQGVLCWTVTAVRSVVSHLPSGEYNLLAGILCALHLDVQKAGRSAGDGPLHDEHGHPGGEQQRAAQAQQGLQQREQENPDEGRPQAVCGFQCPDITDTLQRSADSEQAALWVS
jgi:hypothetical protein